MNTNPTTDVTNQPTDREETVLFECDPRCGRILFRLNVVEGRVAPYEGSHATTWEIAVEQAHREGFIGEGFCTNLGDNGAEGNEGWCFLKKTGGKKETFPVR